MMKSRNLARFSKGEALEDCNHNSIAILLDVTDRVVKDFPRLDYIGFYFRTSHSCGHRQSRETWLHPALFKFILRSNYC